VFFVYTRPVREELWAELFLSGAAIRCFLLYLRKTQVPVVSAIVLLILQLVTDTQAR
jgi:hypothetical protein